MQDQETFLEIVATIAPKDENLHHGDTERTEFFLRVLRASVVIFGTALALLGAMDAHLFPRMSLVNTLGIVFCSFLIRKVRYPCHCAFSGAIDGSST